MTGRKKYSVLRDPVHGDIYLTDEEMRVLDTPEMQRLRGVRQLGTAYLVYPGALHTRFDHSIGTLHVTQQVIDSVNLNAELDPRGTLGIGDEEARVIRMAALVHDVTHIPFGHNIEDQTGLFHRHDSAYRYERTLGSGTELGRALEHMGLRRDILGILAPGAAGGGGHAVPSYWTQVLADTICSDILDYLARDAYFTGLKLSVDPRITSYFKIDRESGNLFIDLAKRDLLREDILSEIVRMLEARYYFSERVYYHHAKVAAGALLARAVELCVVGGQLQEEDFYDLTDASLLDLLEGTGKRMGDADGERVQKLVSAFRGRKLLKRACVFPRYENAEMQEGLVTRFFAAGGSAAARADVEHRIADLVRFATGVETQIVLYCPAARMQLKEVQTHVRWPGAGIRPLSDYSERVPRLADLERSYRDLWKFYVFAESSDAAHLAVVQRIAREELEGASNAYRVEP